MKLFAHLASLAIAALPLAATPAIANDLPHFSPSTSVQSWRLAATGAKGEKWMVDVGSIRRNQHIVFFWQHLFLGPSSPATARSAQIFTSANCNTYQYRNRFVVGYDANFNSVGVEALGDDAELKAAYPNTLMADVLDTACSK